MGILTAEDNSAAVPTESAAASRWAPEPWPPSSGRIALFFSLKGNPSISEAAEYAAVALMVFFNPCTFMHLKYFIKINKSN